MIILAAAIFDDYAGVCYAVKPPGISKILPKGSIKTFVASILPEAYRAMRLGLMSWFFKNVAMSSMLEALSRWHSG
jgi:hypothetical protein